MAGRRGLWLLGFCFMGVLAAGCGPPAAIYVETTLHPDGSCDRMIWQPKESFETGLEKTVQWYLANLERHFAQAVA